MEERLIEKCEYGLDIEGLTVDLVNFRLDNITLKVPRGCITGLIGRNGAGGFLLASVFLYSTGFALLYTNLTAKAAKLPVIIAAFAVWAGLYAAIFIFGNLLNGLPFVGGGIFVAVGRTPLGWVFAGLFAVFGIMQITAGVILCAKRLKPKDF